MKETAKGKLVKRFYVFHNAGRWPAKLELNLNNNRPWQIAFAIVLNTGNHTKKRIAFFFIKTFLSNFWYTVINKNQYIMKRLFNLSTGYVKQLLVFAVIIFSLLAGCNKLEHLPAARPNDAGKYSSEVIDKWLTMQIRLMKNATGIPNVLFCRYYAYTGLTAYEAIAPGTWLGEGINSKLNGLTNLPLANGFKLYYWPASVNAALAAVNRSIFVNASMADKAAIDSLENALNTDYSAEAHGDVLTRSNEFGKSAAAAVFNWSATDGIASVGAAYTPPVGAGLWVPTPPAFGAASTPYFGNLRTIVTGSTNNSQPGAPIAYSEDPNSAFYKMVLNVYTVSQNLNPVQKSQGLFWRDIPGVTTGGHWESILQQVLKQTSARLDKAAVAYAVTGICNSDPSISCWQTKYHYNLVRPVTYIRNVMGFSSWNPLITTPAHPEYSSVHAVLSAATADAFTALFGDIGNFTDHTYDYLGFTPRTFSSFRAIGEDAGNSRVFAGIHYQPSVDTGLVQGRKVAATILSSLGLSN